jgi:hypothetical protein
MSDFDTLEDAIEDVSEGEAVLENEVVLEEDNRVEPEVLIEEPEELDKVALIGLHIRESSMYGRLNNAEDFLDEPFSLEVEEALSLLEELKSRDDFSDIIFHKGKETLYMYSDKYMSNNYAKLLILVEEKDMFRMIAETVRDESKTYPRPTDARLFTKAPFNLTRSEFQQVYEELRKKEEYSDIKEVRASNQALYLFSDKFMKEALAKSLAEWIEVEAEQNP